MMTATNMVRYDRRLDGLPKTQLQWAEKGQLQGPVLDTLTLKNQAGILVRLASGAASAYHGVRKNRGSIAWGLWWFFWGAAIPGFVPLAGYAQYRYSGGYPEPKKEMIEVIK